LDFLHLYLGCEWKQEQRAISTRFMERWFCLDGCFGFSILPDDHSSNKTIVETSSDGSSSSGSGGNSGCLLTFGFQILLCGLGTSKMTSKSVDTVNEHIARIIQNIKDALEVA
jgi:hypothetical protein